MFDAQSHIVDTLVDEAKTAFYTRKIGESAGHQKSLLKIFDKQMNRRANNSLPSHQSSSSLVERFGDFFNGKIEKICSGLDSIRDKSSGNEDLPPCHGPSMSFFTPATVEEVRLIIKNSPTKSCELDPLPTWLLKECLEDLLPAIVNIINRSLETGVMPHAFKQATEGLC